MECVQRTPMALKSYSTACSVKRAKYRCDMAFSTDRETSIVRSILAWRGWEVARFLGAERAKIAGSHSTSMSLQGDYKHEEGDLVDVPIQITRGYSKDGRPDLKQFISSLVMSDRLPIFIQALSDNTSDKHHFRVLVIKYGESLQKKWGDDKIQRR